MTVREAVEKTDALFPNVLSFSKKAEWLRELDMKVFSEFICFFEGQQEKAPAETYSSETVLLIPDTFAEVYIRYICLQADIVNGDFSSYKNNAALFNSAYLSFMNHFNRTHIAKKTKIRMSEG